MHILSGAISKDNIVLMNMLQIVQNKAAKTIVDLPSRSVKEDSTIVVY